MSCIEKIRHDHGDLARTLKKHRGIRRTVEELYPDDAHFIYELLQNSEDTGASEVGIKLTEDRLTFEHNGRPFDERDIRAICDIGEGTKSGDHGTIGRFGIGFKAVFAYTETPRIWSPTYSFEISDLVLPTELSPDPSLGGKTRFQFPFNNPKKPQEDAFEEVARGLEELAQTTLLFLTHVESIRWEIPGTTKGEVLRIRHSEHHIEVLKETNGRQTSSSHFLLFSDSVQEMPNHRVAIAFPLDLMPETDTPEETPNLGKRFKIIPANPGRVSVFFPAEKETSGLRFHLHGPFVPELSRASIKDTPANEPLFRQLAELSASSLEAIRELGLLTGDFLGVLPNPKDEIPVRYNCIREAIIAAMNERPLTPTHSKSHAPAKVLLQARASLKNLLSHDDLEFLVEDYAAPPEWAIGATQKNGDVDRFLEGLDIRTWNAHSMVVGFTTKATRHWGARGWVDERENFIAWIASQTEAWHQALYALLYRELEASNVLEMAKSLSIVRLGTGEHSVGGKCFFPSDDCDYDYDYDYDYDEILPRVARGVYTSGKTSAEQERAKRFLESVGVREVGESEQIQAILDQFYTNQGDVPDRKTHLAHLERFIALVEETPGNSVLFTDRLILEGSDALWHEPKQLYLDSPFRNTGLRSYYEPLGVLAGRFPLAKGYEEVGIAPAKLGKFAGLVGAVTSLVIEQVDCSANPDVEHLHSAPGLNPGIQIDRDFALPHLQRVLEAPTVQISELIWWALRELPRPPYHWKSPDRLKACYQLNARGGPRYAPSQLVYQLRNSEWVPQGNDTFVRPAEASRDLLPEGFAFDPGWRWLEEIHFGADIEKETEDHQRKTEAAETLGLEDAASIEAALWYAKLQPDERQHLRREYERRDQVEFPENALGDPKRRAARVAEQAADALERLTEERTRTVAVNRDAVKKDTDPYLRQQYTNDAGEMVCQVCKQALPFKLANGDYYFEAVEFLPELKKRHYQNYLSLCPNHAAMFKHANGSDGEMLEEFVSLEGEELYVILAEEGQEIRFRGKHLADLKAVIESDQGESVDEDDGE